MDELYSPDTMRHLVHNSMIQSLKRREEKRSHEALNAGPVDCKNIDSQIMESKMDKHSTSTLPRSKSAKTLKNSSMSDHTLPRTRSQKQHRLSSGYGSFEDDIATGMFKPDVSAVMFKPETIVEMRPKPENSSPAKRRLALRHSLEGPLPEEKENSDRTLSKSRDRGSWSPMNRLPKMRWLHHRKDNNDESSSLDKQHDKHHAKAQRQESVDEGLHLSMESDFDEDEEEGGFKSPRQSNSKRRQQMLRRSLPNPEEFQKQLTEDFMTVQGHEHPYSIMSAHTRHGVNKSMISSPAMGTTTGGTSSLADNSTESMAALNNENSPDFYLKNKKKSTDATKREKKNKKSSGLSGWLKRSKKSSENVAPFDGMSSMAGARGKWFGQPLSDICDGETLPKPIMSILEYLFHNGPYVEGIFRRGSSEMRKKDFLRYLDETDEELTEGDIECRLSTLDIASVIKNFIRDIPDCLLRRELTSEWLGTLEIKDPRERTEAVKSLLTKLPACNFNLLRHLVCVLIRIIKFSNTNKMTVGNISTCIAPSLLPINVELAKENMSMVKDINDVVTHLVENAIQIFGFDVTGLFGAPRSQDSESMKGGEDDESMNTTTETLKALASSSSAATLTDRLGNRESSTDSDSIQSVGMQTNVHHNSSIESFAGVPHPAPFTSSADSLPSIPYQHNTTSDSQTNMTTDSQADSSEMDSSSPRGAHKEGEQVDFSTSRDSGLASLSDSNVDSDKNMMLLKPGGHAATAAGPPTSSAGQQRKYSYARSVSQFDEPTCKEEDSGAMTRSFEEVLDSHNQPQQTSTPHRQQLPIPPPRRNRQSITPAAELTKDTTDSANQVMPPQSSSKFELKKQHFLKASQAKPTRGDFQDLLDETRQLENLGTMHISDSGSKLYIDEDVVNRASYSDPSKAAATSSPRITRLTQPKRLLPREQVLERSIPPLQRSLTEVTTSTYSPVVAACAAATRSLCAKMPAAAAADKTPSMKERLLTNAIKYPAAQTSQEPAEQRRRAGMTENGSDFFPAEIQRSLAAGQMAAPARDTAIFIPRSAQLVRAASLERSKREQQSQLACAAPAAAAARHLPSYHEVVAARRNSSQCFANVSEHEILYAKANSARARQMFEQSMRIFQEEKRQEESSSPARASPARPAQPPTYEEAVKREQMKPTSPKKAPSMVTKSGRVRRHKHRSSDTQLESVTYHQFRESKTVTASRVTRSKSDVSDHKMARFQNPPHSTSSEEDSPKNKRRLRASKSAERVDKPMENNGYDSDNSDNGTDQENKEQLQLTKLYSLKSKDWHQELAKEFRECQPEATQIKYAVNRAVRSETQGKPFVLPTYRHSNNSGRFSLPRTMSSSTSHPGALRDASNIVMAINSVPSTPVKQAVVKSLQQTVPVPLKANIVSSDSGKSTGKSSANNSDSDAAASAITWSVASIKKNFESNTAPPTPQLDRSSYTGSATRHGRPAAERTNPNSSRDYV